MKKKNKEQRCNDQHHSLKEERMEEQSLIDLRNLDIYKKIECPELRGRDILSSWYNGVYAD